MFRELDQNMQFRVLFACILLQKPKKPLRSVDDADDELDDASSVQIILLIRIVHIIFFRISTQKALRATLLRGCFLVYGMIDEFFRERAAKRPKPVRRSSLPEISCTSYAMTSDELGTLSSHKTGKILVIA